MGTNVILERQARRERPLLGVTLNSFDPTFIEIAGRFDYDVLWIEMEHSCMTMREAELLCRLASGAGMLSLIRLPSGERDVALRAAETGVDMLMVPMITEPSELEQFVAHTRYAPDGQRGFYRYSRALNYGLGSPLGELRRRANERLILWGQVETLSALHRIHELCQVDGIDGMFMGPGDLSSAYGIPGQVSDSRVTTAVETGISAAREYGKLTGTVTPPSDVRRWADESANLLFVGGNVEWYVKAAEASRAQLQSMLGLKKEFAVMTASTSGLRSDTAHLGPSQRVPRASEITDSKVRDD